MASSVSGQDKPNWVLWLVTWAGKIELSCLLRTTICVRREKFPHKPNNKSFIDQVSLVKMAGRTVCLHSQIAKANCGGQNYTQFFCLDRPNPVPFWLHNWVLQHFCILDSEASNMQPVKYCLNCQVVKILERFICRLTPGSKEIIPSSKEIILSHQIIFTCARYLNPSISSILNWYGLKISFLSPWTSKAKITTE